ncbi:MAG: 2-oxo acid dehydrogenase subunit E2 [Chloroflexi bacterium]|jgi:pyruvate dehydrogenase E2 component (dihydrolipoamide acetyltransferase)|nr:2-oxo acid dehydrogenase subunit E2 [Chloroflexota bacterium]
MAELVTMPKLGFDMAEGVLVRWVVAEGGAIERGQVLAEIETDKATVEVESAFSGVVLKHLSGEGDVLPVGAPISVIGNAGEAVDVAALTGGANQPEGATPAPEAESSPEAAPPDSPAVGASTPEEGQLPGGVKASPIARRMAAEHSLDLSAIRGSGPGGRVIKADIETFLAKPSDVRRSTSDAIGLPSSDETVKLTKLRTAIGRRMTESKQQLPHFYVTGEYDMAALMDLRKQVNVALVDAGEKVSVNDFIVKAVALALRQFPNLNASLKDGAILRHGEVNVGVAVAVEGGLLTIVNRHADRKSLRQISADTRAMVGRAREGKVRPDDIEGSTFSVSNLGMFDVENFIAIINPPEAAILAVGAVRSVPVVANGEIKPGLRMKATISVDHRVSDGAEAAQFMQVFGKYLENPLNMIV